eukprot:1156318-Pelagomonas_calceolata.AAC.8
MLVSTNRQHALNARACNVAGHHGYDSPRERLSLFEPAASPHPGVHQVWEEENAILICKTAIVISPSSAAVCCPCPCVTGVLQVHNIKGMSEGVWSIHFSLEDQDLDTRIGSFMGLGVIDRMCSREKCVHCVCSDLEGHSGEGGS